MRHVKLFEAFEPQATHDEKHKAIQCVITFNSVEIYGDKPDYWPINTHTITTEFLDRGSEEANKKAALEEIIAGAIEIGGDPLWCDQLETALSEAALRKMAEKSVQKSDPLDWFLEDLAYEASHESSLMEYWQRPVNPEDEERDKYGEIYDPEDALVYIYNDKGLEPKVEFKILRDDLTPEEVKGYQAIARLRKRII